MARRKKLWPCEVEAQMEIVGGEQRKLTELAPKTVDRIAKGMQKFFCGDKRRGPQTKNYWIMKWVMTPGHREMSPAEIQRTMARLRKKSIVQIQKFIQKESVTLSDTGRKYKGRV